MDSFPIDTEVIGDGNSVIADDRCISAEESAPDIDRNMRDICPNGVFDAHKSNDENSQQVASEDSIIAENKGTSSEEPTPKVEHIVQQTCRGGVLRQRRVIARTLTILKRPPIRLGHSLGELITRSELEGCLFQSWSPCKTPERHGAHEIRLSISLSNKPILAPTSSHECSPDFLPRISSRDWILQ